jgi:hypothetical protein
MGGRLIAVNDGIDTAEGEDDFLPFRAIMAEWYAKDCSKKIRAVVQAKGKSGKPTTNIPPYGYVKSPDDKNKWLIDPEAAAVVKRIFEMTIDGMGSRAIAMRFLDEKVERPSSYFERKGVGRFKGGCDTEHAYSWNLTTITELLDKMEYAGHTVNFKGTKPCFKSKKRVMNSEDDRLIFRNTHEAIVTDDVWELAQKLRQTKRRADSLGESNPLTGLLWCGTCGAKMFNKRKAEPPKRYRDGKLYCDKKIPNSYHCSQHSLSCARYIKKCTPHHIATHTVRQVILELLRETNGYVREHESEFIELVREKSALRHGETAKAHKKKIAKNERRIAELEKIYRSLYEDKALGKLDEVRFEEMSAGYIQEQADLKTQTAEMQAELDAFNADTVNVEKFVELVKRYTDFDELSATMINEFIDKIIVHEAEWSDGYNPKTGRGRGSRSQKIEVYLKYIGSFDVPDMRSAEEIEAERVALERLELQRKKHREKERIRLAEKESAATSEATA